MDKKEFVGLVEPLKSRLYKTAYLYLGNEAGAMEAVDEAIYKGLRARYQLRQREFFATWMTRILINECKKELKRQKKLYPVADVPEDGGNCEAYDQLPLKEAIAKLPEALRAVIILRYFSDYTLAETAKCLNIPQGTVVTRQRRALALLKLELSVEEELL